MKYYVIVRYTKHEEYPLASGYFIEAGNPGEAEKEARKRYSQDFGFDITHITARVSYRCVAP